MTKKTRVVYYLNQFFGQVGGEDMADIAPFINEGGVGPSLAFNKLFQDEGEVVATVVCGDNYFNEKTDAALESITKMIEDSKPDLVITGPAFNAGRYGMACATVADHIGKKLNVPVITGMYIENPAVDMFKDRLTIAEVGASAADMKKGLTRISNLASKIVRGEELGEPSVDMYIPQGKRKTVFVEDSGAKRAVDMLMNRLNDKPFTTELPMPVFDDVTPAPAIKDLSKATIAIVTSGGIVPKGNPDKIQSASAQKWGRYDISNYSSLKDGGFVTIHGGYDPVYANNDPDRVAPLAVLREFQKEGKIGDIHKYFYTTTGTGTSVGNARKFGKEMGELLKNDGVDAVILTST